MAHEEQLAEVMDHLLRATLDASVAREHHKADDARRHHRAAASLLEQAQELLPQIEDVSVSSEHEPEIRRMAAALALIDANLHAGERSLEHNRMVYASAIELTNDLPSEFEGRARSSFGAVLMYFEQWDDAVTELQLARQCLHTPGLLAPWALTTCRLGMVYWELRRITDAMRVLGEITGTLIGYQSRHLSRHHLAATILMVRILWRRGQVGAAKRVAQQATSKLRQQGALLNTPEYATLRSLDKLHGIAVYELREKFSRRTLDL